MAKALSKTPLGEAIDKVRADLKQKDYVENEFYKELLSGDPQLDSPEDGTPQSQVSADKLRQYMKDLEPQVRGRRDYHILSRVGPFVDSLQTLMKTCETLFQATPFGVSIVFSGAQILLRISSSLNDYFDTVLEAMDRIGISEVSGQFISKDHPLLGQGLANIGTEQRQKHHPDGVQEHR
jgi:hypothetical protein